jgi:hypothetical protein
LCTNKFRNHQITFKKKLKKEIVCLNERLRGSKKRQQADEGYKDIQDLVLETRQEEASQQCAESKVRKKSN